MMVPYIMGSGSGANAKVSVGASGLMAASMKAIG